VLSGGYCLGTPPGRWDPYVRDVSFETHAIPEDLGEGTLRFTTSGAVFTGRVGVTPAGYRALFRRTHPRVRRMHAAYGRRRR
jgi:hypothetical protein